nr:DEAD/DEAH box helicase [Chitinispirillaceae bacterium]
MSIEPFSPLWSSPFFDGINGWCQQKSDRLLVKGLAGSGDAMFISDLFRSTGRPLAVFVENNKRAEQLCDECRTFLSDDAVEFFPSRDAVPYNLKSPFGPVLEARFRVLGQLLDGQKKVFIAPHAALVQKIVAPKTLFNRVIRLHQGNEVPLETLSRWLTEIGFRRENQATDIGIFSIRGGIIDIYPFLTDNPVRVEYWGDRIESIREFDVFSQKSLASMPGADIFPMREFSLSGDDFEYALEKMRDVSQQPGTTHLSVERFEHQWKSMADAEGIEWFLHWFDLATVTLFDYLAPETIVVWDDLIGPARRLDETRQNYERHLLRVPDLFAPFVSKPHELLHPEQLIAEKLAGFDTAFLDTVEAPADCGELCLAMREQPQLPRELVPLTEALTRYSGEGMRCVLLSPNIGHAERLEELLGETCPSVEISIGFLNRGFIVPDKKLLLFSENQIMGRTDRAVRFRKRKGGMPLSGFDALAQQDFVVHEEHGIARFAGIERIRTGERHTDCMVLYFADNARVYVPIEDFHKVQKYIGKESVSPTLSTIGTGSWERLKNRTRESLQKMAQELIDLYAKRQYLEGIAFAPDTIWQKEFEDAFIYEETADQLRAISEVKHDMESKKPMDRLICGDVGFGKTEVAMRAAFKAAMAGYQVAILAPTTILAAQHFATFSARMASFPVKLACLSRFQSGKEIKGAVARIATGDIDIVIGTHRVLSSDVVFKNLGLLIIDEEQRFGVKHKEKLKHFRHTIDVLSLTATPIPRTL